MNNNIHVSMGGVFTISRYSLDADGNPTPKIWLNTTNNMILDSGLAAIANIDSFMDYVHLGSGITTPNPLQIALANKLVATRGNRRVGDDYSVNVAGDLTNPYHRLTRTYRVEPSGIDQTYTEIGVGWNTEMLFSRSLLKNSSGDNESIFIPAGDYVEIVYQLTVYIPAGETVTVITPTGNPSDDITVTIKAAGVKDIPKETSGAWSLHGAYDYNVSTLTTRSLLHRTGSFFNFGPGPIGNTIADIPTTVYNGSKTIWVDYEGGNSATFRIWSYPNENTGSIRCAIVSVGFFSFQVEFNPPIDKGANDELFIYFTLSWGRVIE